MNPVRIGIVGAGPGGLITAHLLERRAAFPCAVTLFEASKRVGGKILTRRFQAAPVRYEAGTAELYDYSHLGPDPLRGLIAELDLSTSPLAGETVVLDGRILRQMSDTRHTFGEATWASLCSFYGQARALISPAEYSQLDWKADGPAASETFRALLDRVPDEAARRYIEVAVHSDAATEPHRTSAIYGLQNVLMTEQDYVRLYTIDGGLERLPQELAARLDARVLLEHRVLRVERTPRDTYRVLVRHRGHEHCEEFDYVVVALPNNWIPAIAWGGTVLGEAMCKHHAHYDHPAHYLRISVLFRTRFWGGSIDESYFILDAFGGACVYDESSRDDGCSYGVLGWLLAGNAALSLANESDEALVEMALDSLPDQLRAGRALVLEGRVHRWVGSVSGLPGGPAPEPDSLHQPEPTQHEGLFVVGDYLFDSTLNGVFASAEAVSDRIVEDVEAELAARPPVFGTSTNGADVESRARSLEPDAGVS